MIKYIDKQGESAIKTFGYIGSNLSLSYNHLWGPLAEKLLNYVPESMAPNTMTLVGFLCVVVGHALVMLTGNFGQPVSTPVLIAFGLLMLIYQTLDNLDGKQARRTKSASPLGMLFDHGSDSLCCFLIASSVMRILCLTDSNIIIFVMIIHVLSVFFCAIWSQYNTGNFQLGRINPVDDGIPSVAVLAFIQCLLPQGIWKEKFLFTTLNHEVLIFLLLPLFGNHGTNIAVLYSFTDNTLKHSKHTRGETLSHIIQPIVVLLAVTVVALFGPTNYIQNNLYSLMYSVGFLWSRNIIIMQLSYISKKSINIFNYPLFIFVVAHIVMPFLGLSYGQQGIFAMAMVGLQTFFWFEFVISVIQQMSDILNIKVFSIAKPIKPSKEGDTS